MSGDNFGWGVFSLQSPVQHLKPAVDVQVRLSGKKRDPSLIQEEVSGHNDSFLRDVNKYIGRGMSPAEVIQLHSDITQVQNHPVIEGDLGRCRDKHIFEVINFPLQRLEKGLDIPFFFRAGRNACQAGCLILEPLLQICDPAWHHVFIPGHSGENVVVSDYNGIGKDLVAEAVVPMGMGIDDISEVAPAEFLFDNPAHFGCSGGQARSVHDNDSLFR